MSKLQCSFILLCLLSTNVFAVEPVLQQQGLFYFNMSFDTDQHIKTEHNFGFRVDRALLAPGENISMSQLVNNPAVFNLKLNNHGLQAFEFNGVDYSYIDNVYHAAEADTGAETQPEVVQQEPKRKIDFPIGVFIGVGIGVIAIGAGL